MVSNYQGAAPFTEAIYPYYPYSVRPKAVMRHSHTVVNVTIGVSIAVSPAGAFGTYGALRQFPSASAALSAAQESQLSLEQVLSLLLNAETRQRGFLLTQRPSYQEPYNAALADLDIELGRLASAFVDQPEQRRALAQLGELVAMKRDELAQTIRAAQTQSFGTAPRSRTAPRRSWTSNEIMRGVVLVFRDATLSRAAERALREADRRKDEFWPCWRTSFATRSRLFARRRRSFAPVPRRPRSCAGARRSSSGRWGTWRACSMICSTYRGSHAARLEIRRSRVTVDQVVDAAVEMARPLLDMRRHSFTIHLPVETVWLDADPLRMAQVIGNLLTNAAKFTPVGGRVELHASEDDSGVIIQVVDNGVGLAPDALAKIFDMFVQIASPLERTEGGLGIGLALAKGLVELHGGTIAAASAGPGMAPRSRCVCRVHPPQHVTQPTHASAVPAAPPAPALRVLVADDNRDAAESLAMLLRLAGHEVTTVHDGGAAWEFGRDGTPGRRAARHRHAAIERLRDRFSRTRRTLEPRDHVDRVDGLGPSVGSGTCADGWIRRALGQTHRA